MKILVIQTAFWGDLLLAVPLLRACKSNYPRAQIYLVCRKGLGSFLESLGLVNKFFEIDKKNKNSKSAAFENLKKEKFDIIFAPHQSFRTAFLVRELQSKIKIGFRTWWNFLFFTHRVKREKNLPDALRQLSLFLPLKSSISDDLAGVIKAVNEDPRFFSNLQADGKVKEVPDWASMDVVAIAKLNRRKNSERTQKHVVLAPGSVWATKRWEKDGFKKVAEHFLKNKFHVTLIGTKEEDALCREIAEISPKIRNICGQTTPEELVRTLLDADVLITNDSGAMHTGSLVSLPTVAIFGPTTLDLGYRPWQTQALVVERKLACRPCGKHGHTTCPIGTHECMKGIGPEMVIDATYKLLAGQSRS